MSRQADRNRAGARNARRSDVSNSLCQQLEQRVLLSSSYLVDTEPVLRVDDIAGYIGDIDGGGASDVLTGDGLISFETGDYIWRRDDLELYRPHAVPDLNGDGVPDLVGVRILDNGARNVIPFVDEFQRDRFVRGPVLIFSGATGDPLGASATPDNFSEFGQISDLDIVEDINSDGVLDYRIDLKATNDQPPVYAYLDGVTLAELNAPAERPALADLSAFGRQDPGDDLAIAVGELTDLNGDGIAERIAPRPESEGPGFVIIDGATGAIASRFEIAGSGQNLLDVEVLDAGTFRITTGLERSLIGYTTVPRSGIFEDVEPGNITITDISISSIDVETSAAEVLDLATRGELSIQAVRNFDGSVTIWQRSTLGEAWRKLDSAVIDNDLQELTSVDAGFAPDTGNIRIYGVGPGQVTFAELESDGTWYVVGLAGLAGQPTIGRPTSPEPPALLPFDDFAHTTDASGREYIFVDQFVFTSEDGRNWQATNLIEALPDINPFVFTASEDPGPNSVTAAAFATPWNTVHAIYHDSIANIYAVWIDASDANATWRVTHLNRALSANGGYQSFADTLSRSTDIGVAVTAWNGLHIFWGNGNALWWVPDNRDGTWNLERALFSGDDAVAISLPWGGMSLISRDDPTASSALVTTWWAPGKTGWTTEQLGDDIGLPALSSSPKISHAQSGSMTITATDTGSRLIVADWTPATNTWTWDYITSE
ncbi:MAG: hypothetical protein AAF747_01100 [Planctomycetota bacterium]